jgi:hypothetical protein
MKIASANLQMASSHAALQHRETKESLRMWVGQQRPNFEALNQQRPRPANDSVSISDAGKSAQSADDIKKELDDAVDRDPGLNLIRQMLEFLTGEKIKVTDVADLHTSHEQSQSSTVSSSTARQSSGFGVEYSRSESYTETEQTSFAASGTVKTADGKEISFSIELSMARSYHEESSVSLRLGDAAKQVDPLILNFGGTAAQLADQRFSFDLNSDGKQEQINSLKQGSGFLVFDRNNDGKINNGHEMFGPSSGNGFSELSALDDDDNGWIDENDSAYSKLQVWQGARNGQGELQSLAAAGVGAIALSHVSTPFSIKNETNDLLAQVRNSGIFLQHNGEAGTIQHVDLTV